MKYQRLEGFNHPSLREIVPIEIRLQIYKNALLFLKSDKKYRNSEYDYNLEYDQAGLCILLPCILWNLKDYLSNPKHSNEDWAYQHTSIAFPELTKDVIDNIEKCDSEKAVKKRIKYLKQWIKILKC